MNACPFSSIGHANFPLEWYACAVLIGYGATVSVVRIERTGRAFGPYDSSSRVLGGRSPAPVAVLSGVRVLRESRVVRAEPRLVLSGEGVAGFDFVVRLAPQVAFDPVRLLGNET